MQVFKTVCDFLKNQLEFIITSALILATLFGLLLWLPLLYLLFTPFWWLTVLTIIWIYLDRNTPDCGGRSKNLKLISWVNSRPLSYFQARALFTSDLDLNPKKNYLVCFFPHGVFPCGSAANFISDQGDMQKKYPEFKFRMFFSSAVFLAPFVREWLLASACVSCSAKSFECIFGGPEGGYIGYISPGGAREACYTERNNYKLFLKNRKGFVRMALKYGLSIIPSFTFGEQEVYEKLEFAFMKPFYNFFMENFLFVPIMPNGRGLFQNYFGLCPRKYPLTTVIGTPLDCEKVQNPTQDQINFVHQKFLKELKKIFDINKYNYLPDPENAVLEIV